MSELVVKDNALMNASYNLDLVEQRLILLAIVEARESGKGVNTNDPLTVHAESYINQFGVARQTAYQALKDACDDLFARQFSYQEINARGNTENVRSRWVSEIRYVDAEATVKLIFAPIVIPLITRLEERFTQYEMRQISELSTGYAIRLYELLICWRTTGKTPVIELTSFRQKMGVLDNEYQRMYDLKKYVLEPSLKQINEHTDITASYEQHKKGRVITGFSFKFKQKKKNSDKTPKKGDSSPHTEKPSPIHTNFVKQPENASMSDLDKRASQIAGLIMSNGLTARFKQGDESSMDMMKRIKQEIFSNEIADQWQSKLEEFGVVFDSK
jgi:plasmid replication initiation protein